MSPRLQAREPFAGYSDDEQPLGSYAALAALFNLAFAGALVAAARRERLPDRVRFDEILTLAFATHKLARLVTKDSVTSFVRAPFVHLEEKSGSNSLDERPRGRGLRRSLGELLSCPECTGQWVAGALVAGMLHAPRATRAITTTLTALALADLLQFAYVHAKGQA